MKVTKFDTREEWLSARQGKITGTRLKDIIVKRGTGKKIGFYELIAERISVSEAGTETPMDRGTRLEPEAIELYEQVIGKKINTDLVIWEREDLNGVAISPDGYIDDIAVEVKCLSSARHLEAYLTQEVPDELKQQVIQYFCVNDSLKEVHSVFYDPRIAAKDLFVIITKREDVADEIAFSLDYQKQVLVEVEKIVIDLTF